MSLSIRRVAIMAEMHGRDLTRRHAAIALLIALPLSFYFASVGSGASAVLAGGVGMSFSVSGATLFSVLSSKEVDQRLVLGGYGPLELLLGRLLFLGPFGLVIALAFSAAMSVISHPARPLVLALGVAVVALQSVPFGLAVGAALPRELEGTLVLIGVIGLQLSASPDSLIAKALPFYSARQIIASSLEQQGSIAWPLFRTAIYGLVLLVIARIFVARRVDVTQHSPLD